MGFVCMLSAELGQLCLGSNPAQRRPETEAPVHQWLPVYVETSVYGIHACTIIVLLSTNTCKYVIGDHSLAISGHQGSSLSHKHGLRVLASFKLPTHSPTQDRVVRVQQLDHGHGVVPITKGQSYQGQEYMHITPTC